MPGLDERRKSGVKWWEPKPASKAEKRCVEGTRERLTKEVNEAQKKIEQEAAEQQP